MNSMKNLFIRTLSEMAAKAMMTKLTVKTTTETDTTGTVASSASAMGGPVGVGLALIAIGRAADAKRKAQWDAAQKRLKQLNNTWLETMDIAYEMVHPLNEITRTIANVNDKFDEWRATLVSMGAKTNKLIMLEKLRVEALEETQGDIAEAILKLKR